MNPATATFTSMDSYAGNIYDPASLHRYLYANANPVKYTDPSGHKPLLRVMTAVCIKVILAGAAMACVMSALGGLVGAVSTAVQGGNTEQVVKAFMNGLKSGALLGAYLGMLSGFVAYCCSVSLIKASAFVVFGHDTSKALTELLFDGDLIKFAKQLPIIFMDYIFYRAACTSEPINLLPGYEGRKETLGNIFKKISESTGGEISSGNVGKGGIASGKNKLALGVSESLDEFALKNGASTWKDFPDPTNWKNGVLDALYDSNTEIIVNLDGVDNPLSSIQRAAGGCGSATDWELLQIKLTPESWDRITWYKDGNVVPNPFEY